MSTQLFKGLVFIAILSLSVSGCKKEPQKGQKNDIPFSTISKEETYHLLGNAENPNCNLQLSFTYPVKYTDKEILSKIQTLFTSSYFGEVYEQLPPEQAVDQYVKDYLEMYKELEEDYKEDLRNAATTPVGAWYAYYETSANDIVFNKDNLISYTVSFENYTGGAHGTHSTTNHVIDLAKGEFLTEEDIFNDGFESALAKMMVDDIAEQNDLTDPKELENEGYFSIDEIYPNGNFLIDDKGITYAFNEYEIAAYVVGVTYVHFPYEKIRHLLRPESPISILFVD